MIARRLLPAVAALVATAALGACGESKEDKATNQVCDARSDIAKQVDTLANLTISSATTNQISQSLKAIADDVSEIKSAQGDLSDERKQQIQSANQAFESQIKTIASGLGSSTSLSDAKAQMTSALQQLADTYKQTYAKVDCST